MPRLSSIWASLRSSLITNGHSRVSSLAQTPRVTNRYAGAGSVSGQPSKCRPFLAMYPIISGPVSCQRTSMLPEESTLDVVPRSQAMFRGQHYFLYYVSFVHSVQTRPDRPLILLLLLPRRRRSSRHLFIVNQNFITYPGSIEASQNCCDSDEDPPWRK